MQLSDSISFAFPEIWLAVAAMVLLLVGVFLEGKYIRWISLGAIGVLAVAAGLVNFGTAAQPASLFDGAFATDGFARFAKTVIYLGAIVAIIVSDRFMDRERIARFEYPVLILLSVLGMSLMVSATDLIAVYMGVELQSLALYILAAFNRDSRRSTEAGLKYFVLGALSSGLMLYGMSLIYGFTGSTTFEAIAAAADEANRIGLVFGMVFLISGLAFKVSAAPFHMWTPDVYEGSPTPVTAFFAAAPKVAGMALFARVLVEAFPAHTDVVSDWQQVIILISILSMAVGAFSAIVQKNIKRLMAYSSIGHMGYALMGIAAGTSQGISSVLVYMTIYLIMTLGTFACILMMRRPEGMAENISDLAGLIRTRPGLGIMFTVLMFSLAGIPFFAGFFAKFYVFMAAVNADLFYLAVIGAIMSVISAFYYLAIIKTIWMDEPAPEFEKDAGIGVKYTAILATTLMVVGIVIVVPPLNAAAQAAAATLF